MSYLDDEPKAVLCDCNQRPVALKGVTAHATLRGLLAEVEVAQNYCNEEKQNIEAVYTFPLPLGAVLLGLEVELAGRRLEGQVVEKKQADRDYEDAITDGHSACMLELAAPGLYTANLGNLMAGETAMIRYRYALPLRWQGTALRFSLPTAIAPRYGDPVRQGGMHLHQVPGVSLSTAYPFHLSVNLRGELARARITCPSHAISSQHREDGLELSLDAWLDRDFVLLLETPAQSAALLANDGEGYAALASLRLPALPETQRPLTLKILLDCSGSMEGSSITQARKGALAILDLLRPQDRFNITLFGSSFLHVFPTLMPAESTYLQIARDCLEKLRANLGGTEMAAALNAVYQLGGEDPFVLLLTDGEVYDVENILRQAKTSGHRVFTVGVGHAVARDLVQGLAERSGGACELVAPQEGMADRIVAQFHRMHQAPTENVQLCWPATPQWQTELHTSLFAGDTVHVYAGFAAPVAGSVTLSVQLADDRTLQASAELISADVPAIPRLAAAARMNQFTGNDAADGLALALRYQLISPWTNYLVVAQREKSAADLPEIRPVDHMLAADWGGSGICCTTGPLQADISDRLSTIDSLDFDLPVFCRTSGSGHSHGFDEPLVTSSISSKTRKSPSTITEKKRLGDADHAAPSGISEVFVQLLEQALVKTGTQTREWIIADLYDLGLSKNIIEVLQQWVAEGYDETRVVAAFLYAVMNSQAGQHLSRVSRRLILKYWKDALPIAELNHACNCLM